MWGNSTVRRAEMAQLERLGERLLANHIAARGVDQNGTAFHPCERLAVDHPLRFGRRRHVDAQDVAVGEQLVSIHAPRSRLALELRLRRAGRVEDPQAEWRGPPADRLPDPPGAEQPEGPPAQLEAKQLFGVPAGPLAAPHEIDAFDEPTGQGEDQRPRQVGGRFREHAGSVGDENPTHLGGHEIDIVVTDGAVRDDPKSGHVFEFGTADPTRQQRDDCHPVAFWRRLISREPGDVEIYELRRLEEILELRSDQYGMRQVLWDRRLLHQHGLPASVPANEDSRVSNLPAERKAVKRARIVRDARQHRDITVEPYGETVVVDRREMQVTACDVTNIVGTRADRAQARDLDEVGSQHAREGHRVSCEQCLPPAHFYGAHGVLDLGEPSRAASNQEQCNETTGHDVPPFTLKSRGPMYSDCGRMRWSSACCSITCAHHPATRPQANVATNERGSRPSACSTSAV